MSNPIEEKALLMERIGGTFANVYAGYVVQNVPPEIVVTAMTGILAACAEQAGVPIDQFINILRDSLKEV